MAPIVNGKDGGQGKYAFVILYADSFAIIHKPIFKYQILTQFGFMPSHAHVMPF